jgi:hypothetical protein
MKFPYKQFPAIPNDAFPNHRKALRPTIPIRVYHKGKTLDYLVLIDSGADFCIFHASIGEALGIDIESGKKLEYFGIEGVKTVAYFHNVQISCVGGSPLEVYAGFSRGFDKCMPYGVLGQKGFFEYFKVIFDYVGEEVELREKPM